MLVERRKKKVRTPHGDARFSVNGYSSGNSEFHHSQVHPEHRSPRSEVSAGCHGPTPLLEGHSPHPSSPRDYWSPVDTSWHIDMIIVPEEEVSCPCHI